MKTGGREWMESKYTDSINMAYDFMRCMEKLLIQIRVARLRSYTHRLAMGFYDYCWLVWS